MNAYKNISNELKFAFSASPVFKVLLPLDMVLLFGGLALQVLGFIVGIGQFLSVIAFWAFIAGLLLTYANFRQQFLYLGLLGYGALQAISFLWYLIFGYGHYFSFGTLAYAIVFGGLGYLAMKKSTQAVPEDNDQGNFNQYQ